MHFVVRAAFFILYLQLSAGARFRFWIGMGFGLDGMLLIFNTLVTVFRCKPITASFRPLERTTAQCMDSRIALFAPATLVSQWLRVVEWILICRELATQFLRSDLAYANILRNTAADAPQNTYLLCECRRWRRCPDGLRTHTCRTCPQHRHEYVESDRRNNDSRCAGIKLGSNSIQSSLNANPLDSCHWILFGTEKCIAALLQCREWLQSTARYNEKE